MKFEGLDWVKGTPQFYEDKNLNLPFGLERKVITPPSRLILIHDGGRKMDISNAVKKINGWKKITEARYRKLKEKLDYIGNFEKHSIMDLLKIEKH